MLATIDVVSFRRRRAALRLLRKPGGCFSEPPAFSRALLAVDDWRFTDLSRIAVVAGWTDAAAALEPPGGRVAEKWRGTFDVQRTHGTLGGDDPLASSGSPPSGPGAIWTVGSVKVRHVPSFLRHNGGVVAELEQSPGLLSAIGVVGLWRHGPWMCTLSFWRDLDAGLAFAYRGSPNHQDAMRKMRSGAFGTRELYFARLGLVASAGTIAGRDPFSDIGAMAA